jgi:uncharacterized membrane protein
MLEDFLQWLGYGLCHQLAERSYVAGGVQAPVCIRDTGIYLGFMLAMILVGLLHWGERPSDFPRPRAWLAMALFLAFMAYDGVSSYSGLRETTNDLRLITGLGVGFSAAALVVPMLNDLLWRGGGVGRVLDPLWRFGVWLAAVPVFYGIVSATGLRLGVAFPVLIAIAIIFTLTAVNLVIVAMLPAFDRRAESVRQLPVPIAIAIAVAFIEIALAAQLRIFLLGLEARILG